MAIQILPESVQSFIRSGITIPSPAQAVEELILNSLDSGASSISVHIDFKYYKIQVTDNGCGMSSDELEAVADRYMTSKCHSLEDLRGNLKYFGYRGEALASIREISGLLSIISRAKGQNEVFCKIFVQGKSNKAEIYDLQPHDVGTTVTIQDFMFNLPVRRTSIREALEMEEIRACVESIAIIHPQVSFNVHNDGKGTLVFQKHINSDILTSFTHIFGQLIAQSLAPISFSNGKFRITGFIGKYPSRHKNVQFLYINKRSLRKTKIHTLINNMLAKSSILRGNGPYRFKPIPEAMNAKSLMSFTKIERNKKFAVFIIQIQCDFRDYEISFDPKKTSIFFQDWVSLSNSIELCIRDFLKSEKLVLSEEPIALISNTSVKCDALKELEELENETSKDNIPSNEKTFDEVPFTHYLPRAVHGLPAKRKKEKERNFPVPKNLTRKIKPNLCSLDHKRICINEKVRGIYSETTGENNSYMESHLESNLDLETYSEKNNHSKCSNQTFPKKYETINEHLEPPATNEFPIAYSGENMSNSDGAKFNNIRKRGNNNFSNLRKFAADSDIKKKKLRSVNQDKDKQNILTSHYSNDYSSDASDLGCRNNSVILSNVESVDASFKFSPRVNLKLKEEYREEQILSQCEIQLNVSNENRNNKKIVSSKAKSILTADDFIHTLENENVKISNKFQCKCKMKNIKSFDYAHSTSKLSEENFPTNYLTKFSTKTGVQINNITVSENFQKKEDCLLPNKIKELYDRSFQNTESKINRLIKTKSSHSQFKEINKYGLELFDGESQENKFSQYSQIITSPYFAYEQGKRIIEDIVKLQGNEDDNDSKVNLSSNYYCRNTEDLLKGQELTSDDTRKCHRSSDEQEGEESSPCSMESMRNANYVCYNYKSYDAEAEVFDSVQFDPSIIHSSYSNSTLNCKEIDSSFCSEENRINYSPYFNKSTDFNNTKANLKKNSEKRIIKHISQKHHLTGGDKIDYTEKANNAESASVVSQNSNWEQLQFITIKQIEGVALKSYEFINSPYFRNRPEDKDKLSANKLVENVSKECDDMSIIIDEDRDRTSIEDNLKNISENIFDENEALINIGESNKNSLIEGNCQISNNATFQCKNSDRNNSYPENNCKETTSTSEKASNDEIYSMEDRFMFLPKGMSPILQYTHCAKKVLSPDACQMLQINLLNEEGNEDDLATVKWQKIFGSECSGSKALIKKLCVEAENGLKSNGDTVKDSYDKKLLKLAEKVSEIMKPFHYTKTIFSNYKLIGQCDKKFIIISCSFVEGKEPHIIGAFDQHAVHERIRVESLLKEYIQDDGNIFKASDLDCELSITLSGKEFRIVVGYKSEFERLGLQFEIEDENKIKLIRVPTCLYNRYLRVTSKRLTVLKDLLQNLITDHVEFLLKTRGIGFGIPEVLLDVINSEACRGAVKFGDPLSETECTQMLHDLAYCNKPFYCAHGRPTFCPIFDMNELHTKRPIMFNKLKPRC